MKERLMTFALALAALVLFAVMFLRGEARFGQTADSPRPTTTERRSNGHYAAYEWLRSEGIRVESWRERLDRLGEGAELASPTGNLLIVTLPASVPLRTEEFLPLARWIREGNTLLVLAALADRPGWAQSPTALLVTDLSLLTGLEFESVSGRDAADTLRSFPEPKREWLVPNRGHAYFEGVQSGVALSDGPARAFRVKVPYDGFVLALAHDRTSGSEAFWTRPLGEGRIVVSAFGSVFTNRAIGEADNARLLANLVAASVGPGGTVVFDDLHQGLGGAYDPRHFYSDARLYVTIAILAGLWLLWVLGATRLSAARPRFSQPREVELVEASGEFFARVLSRPAAARALVEHFLARIRSDAPWSYLARHPRIESSDLERLKAWYAAACASRRVPLGRLHNLLVRIDRAVA